MKEETRDEKIDRYLHTVYHSNGKQMFKSDLYEDYEMDHIPIPIDEFMIQEGLFIEFSEARFLSEKALDIIEQGGWVAFKQKQIANATKQRIKEEERELREEKLVKTNIRIQWLALIIASLSLLLSAFALFKEEILELLKK